MNTKIKLRDWQNRALLSATDKFNGGQKLFLTHATPGGGKTIHGLSVFEHSDKTHVIILAPSTLLVQQWQTDAKKLYGIELKSSMLYSGQSDYHQYNGMVMTYQAMNENHENLRIFSSTHKVVVIADEIHHVSDGQSWGDSFTNAFEHADSILGLTGTPWGANGKKISYVKYGNDGFAESDFSYDKVTAIADNVCRVTSFVGMNPKDLTFIEDESGEIIGEYETIWDAKSDGISGAYTKTLHSLKYFKEMFVDADHQLSSIRRYVPDAGGLIVAPSIRAAREFKDEIYTITGYDYPIVHSKSDKPKDTIDSFKKSSERWLISVDMVTEGVDIKRLQVCAFLSTKNTELFMRQVAGRIERIRTGSSHDKNCYFYYTKTPEVDEFVTKFEDENKAGLELLEDQPEQGKSKGGERKEDGISLNDLDVAQSELTVHGYTFPDEIVRLAILRQRAGGNMMDMVPLFHVCIIIMNEIGVSTQNDESSEYESEPIEMKIKRIRKRIAKEVNRKIGAYLRRAPNSFDIKTAHTFINSKIGLMKTDESTSLANLEKKLHYITNTKASQWL